LSAFFANIQVQSDQPDDVAAAVTALLAHAGFARTPELYGGDRSVYIGAPDQDWVTVLDSAADGTDVGPLAWLARGLSARLQAVTLAWMVHDSVLLYLLFQRGDVADRYVSHPAAFQPPADERSSRPVPPLGGDGDRLLAVTGVAGDGNLVSRWLAQPDAFPQVTLARIAALLGQRHADIGHADVESDLLGDSVDIDPERFTRLEFVRVGRVQADADR
jgi:hypothetical protein